MKLRKGLTAVLASVLMSVGVVVITAAPSYAADPAPMPTGVVVKLIVLGSGGGGLGPIASRVVREAKAPVLIVPFPSGERTS